MSIAGCGGGGGGAATSTAPTPAAACDGAAQNAWLAGYMADWYFWSDAQAAPDPMAYASVASYFDAWRYAGDGVVPRDHWSYMQDSASYNQFFGAGQTMGYGMFLVVAPDTPRLQVAYVEPGSPAFMAGIKRGDRLVSLDGRSSDDLVATQDYALLRPAAGDVLSVEVQSGALVSTVALTADTYALAPTPVSRLLALPDGTKVGYLVLMDFITQAEAPLTNTLADFRAAGATELIVDLRYNGGGRLSTSALLASLVTGSSHGGDVYASLQFNARHQASNRAYRLSSEPGAPFGRVVVLTGSRTCSASELLINGLRPYVDVVTIGTTTCGKPFGFTPATSCGTTFSAVNFETVNALGAGRYYQGITANCEVIEDFANELGDPAEKLTQAATDYLQHGTCPAPQASHARAHVLIAPAGRQRMLAD